jgi:CDP-paratose 2-epimerase
LSLLELVDLLEGQLKRRITLRWGNWRPGDQQVYISDIRKLQQALDWRPAIAVAQGISQLMDWVQQNRAAFAQAAGSAGAFAAQGHVRERPGAALAPE